MSLDIGKKWGEERTGDMAKNTNDDVNYSDWRWPKPW